MNQPTSIGVNEVLPHILEIRLQREAKRNAINNQMLQELADAIRMAEAKGSIRCVILCGATDFFCAGADIQEMRARGVEAIHNLSRRENWSVIESTKIPLVVAVNGICFGGGHELAMLCDIVVASENAQFGQPEIKLGHIPGDGATQRLPRLIGKYRAMQMILTGEPVDAQTAYSYGLISEVVSPGQAESRALKIAQLIAHHSAKALGYAKEAVRFSQELPLATGLEMERRNIALAFTTQDQKEGLSAFFEKRKPEFKDQ